MKNTYTEKITINSLTMDLNSCLSELENNTLTKVSMLNYFTCFMQDVRLDSRLTVEVLEQFGEEGKQEAMLLKINEGW